MFATLLNYLDLQILQTKIQRASSFSEYGGGSNRFTADDNMARWHH